LRNKLVGLLIAALIAADVAAMAYVVLFSGVTRSAPITEVTGVDKKMPKEREGSGKGDGKGIVGPLLLAGAADGSVLRATVGDCSGGGQARVWIGIGTAGPITPVEVPGLVEALSVSPTESGWSVIGTDSGCQVKEWLSPDFTGGSWQTAAPTGPRWYRSPTSNYQFVTPKGEKDLDPDCEAVQVIEDDDGAVILCSSGVISRATLDRKLRFSPLGMQVGSTAIDVDAEGNYIALGRLSGCDAQLSTPGADGGRATYCFGDGKAPLGVTFADRQLVAQVGFTLFQEDPNGEFVVREEAE
jgi:hypothetical protein